MTHEEFDQLVSQIETGVGKNHPALARRVFLLALLGYAGLLAPLAFVVAIGLAFLVPGIIFMPDSLAALILGAFILTIGGWMAGRSLWIRSDAPIGRPIARAEAPALYELIDETRRRVRSAKLHRVLIIPECNAAVAYAPRLGLLGWNRNYLLLGLPLMEGLSRDEFASVLAHECAHLARGHHRLTRWIYRQRRSWELTFARLSQSQRSGGISFFPLVKKFIGWFWPRFNAHAFVLSRAHEYQADAVAVATVGAQTVATALTRHAWHSAAQAESFWPELWQQTGSLAEPPENVYGRLSEFIGLLGSTDIKWLDQAFLATTNNSDTHPSLSERLRAAGRTGTALPEDRAALLRPLPVSAAAELFGNSLASIRADVEKIWRTAIESDWRQRHRKAHALQHRLTRLDTATNTQAIDTLWDKARVLLELKNPESVTPLLRQILEFNPRHAQANFHLGTLLLRAGDAAGEQLLETAIAADINLFPHACEAFHSYYHHTGQADRTRELYVRQDNFEKSTAAARLERNSISPADQLIPHELSPDELAALQATVALDPDVVVADLGRKQLQYSVDEKFFLLCVRVRPTLGFLPSAERAQASVNRLTKQVRLPGRLLIFAPSGSFRGVARNLTRLPGARIFSRH